MFVTRPSLINAINFEGEIIGCEIMVDAANQSDWFEQATGGSGLLLNEIFRVVSVNRFGCARYLNFISEDRRTGNHIFRGKFDGCGEDYRFKVVEPNLRF